MYGQPGGVDIARLLNVNVIWSVFRSDSRFVSNPVAVYGASVPAEKIHYCSTVFTCVITVSFLQGSSASKVE